MTWFSQESMGSCPECGAWTTTSTLRDGLHDCDREVLVEYQVQRARGDLAGIESELACYLQTPRARNLLAFRRYLERRAPHAQGSR